MEKGASFVFASGDAQPLGTETGRRFLVCTADNVAEFNAELRQAIPEAYAIAKALHHAGMLDGLRGAALGPAGSLPSDGVAPVLSFEAEQRIAKARSRSA